MKDLSHGRPGQFARVVVLWKERTKMKRKIWMKLTGILTAALLVTGVTGISMTSYAAESTEEQTDLANVDLAGAAEAQPMKVDMSDGTYKIDVVLGGGSGRATITSPATLVVKEGCAYAQIEWSSSHYDYMMVNGDKYLPVNTEGNSTFEIPVSVFDEPMTVIGDTTAMSVPHEVEYTLTFASESVASVQSSGGNGMGGAGIAIVLALVVAAVSSMRLRRRKSRRI